MQEFPDAMRGNRLILVAHLLLGLALAGCASQPPAQPTPTAATSRTNAGIRLRDGWRATVLVQRDDSILLTLPSGDKQLQRFNRRAGFTLMVDGNDEVSLRLDSLTFKPSGAANPTSLHATWSGRAGDWRVDALKVSGGGDPAAELTAVVRNLLPRLPASGVHARMTWTDSASGDVRVDIFRASERRRASWSTGNVSGPSGSQVLPVLVREDFEQLGDGSQGGHRLTMTAQGRRTGTYYLMTNGQVSGAELDDSVAMLISIPDTRQVVPTMRYGRTTVRFIAAPRGGSESVANK